MILAKRPRMLVTPRAGLGPPKCYRDDSFDNGSRRCERITTDTDIVVGRIEAGEPVGDFAHLDPRCTDQDGEIVVRGAENPGGSSICLAEYTRLQHWQTMSDPLETSEWSRTASEALRGVPSILGYEVQEELGRGGMGVVYQARESNSQQRVALKLIRDASMASPEERARFHNEAEAAARVRHPHVVGLYAVGECNGQPYLAMELVDGGSLATHLSGQAIPSADSAEFVLALARAVQAAHEFSIVHRDLKPANILMASGSANEGPESLRFALTQPTFAGWTPKIADFGLAKRLDRDSTALTQAGAVLGSASYMSPEQAAGRNHEVGVGADVYALGVILYELLTGAPPFRAETWQQTVIQVLRDEPTPPSHRAPAVSADLEAICLHCLEKDPADRYSSAALLADDLAAFLQGKAVAARPITEVERLTRLAAREGYTLVREIGRGPHSVVFQATSEPLRQPVAVKLFTSASFESGAWELHIQQCAERWTAISHPQVVLFQRAGCLGATPYLLAEYAQHGDLLSRMQAEPYTIAQALHVVSQLAEIVGYLHRQGIVHGNLKPANVLFAADGIPRITDFRETSGLFVGETDWTDFKVAELAYLAPESIHRSQRELSPPVDVYGLGLILYELIARRPAFTAASTTDMLDDLQKRDPEPPSRWNNQVSPQLDAVCLRCLKKTPWRRYARAFDLARRLRDDSALL